jgi:hypothetical protein
VALSGPLNVMGMTLNGAAICLNRQRNRSHLHRHAVHAFADMVNVLRARLDRASSRCAALHHLRHVVYRSGWVPRRGAYVRRNGWSE